MSLVKFKITNHPQQRLEMAETFVQRVVTETFKQSIDPATLKAVARKLERSTRLATPPNTGKE